MKKLTFALLAGAMSLAAAQAMAADKVTLQLKWVTQAQFAGYYVAKDKGFYEEEGLDVDIKPGGPDIAPEQVIAGGGADVIVDWMGGALAARDKGVAARQHRPALQEGRHGTGLPEGRPDQDRSRLQGPHARRLVLRQRVSVLRLDEQARPVDRRRRRRRHRAQAVLRRAAADPEAGRLHLGHDLQRVLAADRRRLQAGRPRSSSTTRPWATTCSKTASMRWKTSSRTRPSRRRWSSSSAPR